jgi:serine/threonine protein kinase
LELVFKSGICSADELDAQLEEGTDLSGDPNRLAVQLVRRGVLTTFQAKLLLAGRVNGFKLGPYVIREQLGRGGMGIVYLADHKTLRRKVALKVLIPPKDANGAKLAVERFLREARAAAALNHPNIVRLHDVGQQGTINYLIMELVEGSTLENLLVKGGPITPSRAVGYIAQAAAGLQHAHESGFVHRDIKPCNLMLGNDGTIKILDMGLARSFASSDKLTEQLDSGAILGTSDYISPEQAIGGSEVDIRADIYSLGVTFFALVTGKPPFSGTTPQKLMQHQMKTAPILTELDPTFPEGLAKVVAKMLSKKPSQRYQTPADVIAALAPWLPRDGETKVVAGLSETSVGNSGGIRKTLGGLSKRAIAQFTDDKPVPIYRRKAVLGGAAIGLAVLIGLVAALSGGKPTGPVDNGYRPAYSAANAVPQPPGQQPTPAPSKVKHTPGQVVYRVDATKIPEFREIYTSVHSESGTRPPLPVGVNPQAWKMGSRGEFVSGTYAGARALWVTNMTDVTATQYAIELEASCGCQLEDEQDYVIRMEYRTQGNPEGHLYVQTQKYSHVAGLHLPPVEGEWKSATLKFRRPADTPVRLTLGLKDGGADTTLYIRFLEISRTSP